MVALQQNESQIKLGAMDDKSFTQRTEELCAPEGAPGTAEDAPAGFSNASAGRAFLVEAHLVQRACQQARRWSCANFTVKILALFSRVASARPGTSQLTDQQVCLDQVLLSTGFLQSCGPLVARCSHWVKRLAMVSPLIVRLACESGKKSGMILEGAAQLSRQPVARTLVRALI